MQLLKFSHSLKKRPLEDSAWVHISLMIHGKNNVRCFYVTRAHQKPLVFEGDLYWFYIPVSKIYCWFTNDRLVVINLQSFHVLVREGIGNDGELQEFGSSTQIIIPNFRYLSLLALSPGNAKVVCHFCEKRLSWDFSFLHFVWLESGSSKVTNKYISDYHHHYYSSSDRNFFKPSQELWFRTVW